MYEYHKTKNTLKIKNIIWLLIQMFDDLSCTRLRVYNARFIYFSCSLTKFLLKHYLSRKMSENHIKLVYFYIAIRVIGK